MTEMIRSLEILQTISFVLAWLWIISVLVLIIMDYKAQKTSVKKLPVSHFIIRAAVYVLMVLFVSIWRASTVADAPIRISVFSGHVMAASVKTILQSFPVPLFYGLSFAANQKKE
jgi:hypothetical protein